MFTGAGEVLKELSITGHATIAVIGKEAQKAWDAVKTAREVMNEMGRK